MSKEFKWVTQSSTEDNKDESKQLVRKQILHQKYGVGLITKTHNNGEKISVRFDHDGIERAFELPGEITFLDDNMGGQALASFVSNHFEHWECKKCKKQFYPKMAKGLDFEEIQNCRKLSICENCFDNRLK